MDSHVEQIGEKIMSIESKRVVRMKNDEEDDDAEDDGQGETDSDECVHPVVAETLGFTEVLRCILSFLDVPDLRQCSLVNKKWNYEARSVLRDFKRTFCYLCSNQPCEDLRYFNNDLIECASIVPVNGISIDFDEAGHPPSICVGEKENIGEYYSQILDRIQVKFLEIDWRCESYDIPANAGNCPALKLIRKIFKERFSALEELSIRHLPPYIQLYSPSDITEGRILSRRLRILEFSETIKTTSLQIILDLMRAAPNLEELRLTSPTSNLEFMPVEKLHLIKEYRFDSISIEQIVRFADTNPKLRKFTIEAPLSYFYANQLCDAMKKILISSRQTLEILEIDLFIVSLFLKWNLAEPFEKLENLFISVDFSPPAARLRDSLKYVNFSRLFPALKSVVAVENEHHEHEIPYYESNLPREACRAEPATTITELCAIGFLDEDRVGYFRNVFPQVITFEARGDGFGLGPYEHIWKCWPMLKNVKVFEFDLDNETNLDAQFCGIHAEEAAELQEKDEEYLNMINIVPIRPAVTCLQSLQQLHFSLQKLDGRNIVAHERLFVSKVTGILVFRRMPNLTVSIALDSSIPDLPHLEPYCEIDR